MKPKITKQNVDKRFAEQDFNLTTLTTERGYCKVKGEAMWRDVIIDEDFREESIEEITEMLTKGCRKKDKYKRAFRYVFRNVPLHAWFAQRIFYNFRTRSWRYIEGQDRANEFRMIRKGLMALYDVGYFNK